MYLGHKINKDGIHTNPSKIEAILNITVLKDRVAVRRFLGACAYYKRFIRNFNLVALPLYRLTSRKHKFKWTQTEQEAFDSLKMALAKSIVTHRKTVRQWKLFCNNPM